MNQFFDLFFPMFCLFRDVSRFCHAAGNVVHLNIQIPVYVVRLTKKYYKHKGKISIKTHQEFAWKEVVAAPLLFLSSC